MAASMVWDDGLPSVSPSLLLSNQACPAQADLDEAYDIAERGSMPLYLAEARRLGYWRRKEELKTLEKMLL